MENAFARAEEEGAPPNATELSFKKIFEELSLVGKGKAFEESLPLPHTPTLSKPF